VDMFIAKCGGSSERRENEMHVNNGDGTFTESGAALGLEDDMQTWSSAWADYDNDGDMDAWVGASALGDGFHRLMRNNGDGSFTDVIAASGLTGFTNTDIENQTYDFDNDGNADIVSGGRILYGNGDLTFNVSDTNIGNGGFGDLNNDGFIDAKSFSGINFNNGNSNNWLKINTKGLQSNVDGLGTRVEITTATGTQIRDVRSGEGFRNMSSLNTHFGLGTSDIVETVVVYWPSGVIDTLEDVDVNQAVDLVEGSTLLGIADNTTQDDFILYPNPALDVINFSASSLEGYEDPIYTVFDMTGRRVLHGLIQSNSVDISQLAPGQYIMRVIERKFKRNTAKTKPFTKR
jgi:hypothetical protein